MTTRQNRNLYSVFHNLPLLGRGIKRFFILLSLLFISSVCSAAPWAILAVNTNTGTENGTVNYPTAERVYQQSTNLVTSQDVTNTIVIIPTCPIYRLTATNLSTVVQFDFSALDTNKVSTFETWITGVSTNISLSLPSTNTVYYLATPVLTFTTTNQTQYAVWRYFISGAVTNLFCNQWLIK